MQYGKLIVNNIITGVQSQIQSGGTTPTTPTAVSVIDGKVSTYSLLPIASANTGKVYLVTTSTGVVFVNRRERGLYISDGSSWSLIGDWSALMQDTNFVMWDDGDTTKRMRFELAGISHNSTRIISVPDANIDLSDISSTKSDIATIKNDLTDVGSTFSFNTDGTVASVTTSKGVRTYEYTGGRLSKINGSGIYKSKQFSYDENGRLISISILS